MSLRQKITIQGFFFRLGLIIALIVCIFSFYGGYGLVAVLVRTGLSFLFVFLLGKALTSIWQAVSPPPPPVEQPANKYQSTIDFLLGAEDDGDDNGETTKDIDELGAKGYPGQIASDMIDALQDASKQAEIVRRMGWEE